LFSYCSGMLSWILEKFTNWFEVIWISNTKAIKEIRKQKRKRRKKEKNMKKGQGAPFRPSRETSPRPTYLFPRIGTRFSLPSLTRGPHKSGHRQLLPPPSEILARDRARQISPPPFTSCQFEASPAPIKFPLVPLLPTPFSRSIALPGRRDSTPELRTSAAMSGRFRRD
jgi:hypothetical protein